MLLFHDLGRGWIVRRDDLLALLERRKRERRRPSGSEADPARLLLGAGIRDHHAVQLRVASLGTEAVER